MQDEFFADYNKVEKTYPIKRFIGLAAEFQYVIPTVAKRNGGISISG